MASMEVQQLGSASGPTNRDRVDSSAAAMDPRYHTPFDLHHRNRHNPHVQDPYYTSPATMSRSRKRKAESQDNQRLSKRLSLLNLERNGPKLYVPVENPSIDAIPEHPAQDNHGQLPSPAVLVNDGMQLDDTKHKVYIYDLDAELSSADENSESEASLPGSPTSSRGRLVFLPDIEKHLSRSRIPPAIFASKEGNLAGHNLNDMQMVLYSEPSSLTVPREHDSVRKAILEARARARQRQKDGQSGPSTESVQPNMTILAIPTSAPAMPSFGSDTTNVAMNDSNGQESAPWHNGLAVDNDVDAMDMD